MPPSAQRRLLASTGAQRRNRSSRELLRGAIHDYDRDPVGTIPAAVRTALGHRHFVRRLTHHRDVASEPSDDQYQQAQWRHHRKPLGAIAKPRAMGINGTIAAN